MESESTRIQRVVTFISLGWLATANLVGVILASMLLMPAINDWLAPVTYGRLMPLHTDWQLYGWCALPLLGLLAIHYWSHNRQGEARTIFVMALWSVAMLVGGVFWLTGKAVGKPFLNWTGEARTIFTLVLGVTWIMVIKGWWERRKPSCSGGDESRFRQGAKGVIALALGVVPVVIFVTSRATVYPPVNPHSGGATGHSLLISTLGVVAIMGLLPEAGLGLASRRSGVRWRNGVFVAVMMFSLGVYFEMEHGNASNRHADQLIALATLLVWPPLVYWFWTGFQWSSASTRWRGAFFFWWAALALNGMLSFVPAILDLLKFTNGLVAHAHLAMAGMVTSMNMIMLIEFGHSSGVRRTLNGRRIFWLWNAALVLHVAVLLWQGAREGANPDTLFGENTFTNALYAGRLLAGLVAAGCSLVWLGQSLATIRSEGCQRLGGQTRAVVGVARNDPALMKS